MNLDPAIYAYAIVVAGVVGLLIGSFNNVVAWRVPQGRSVVRPRSACPMCASEIRAYDNIPVVSWLILRGKCRDCGTRISARYPIVELVTGVLFAGVAAWALLQPTGWAILPAYLVLAGVSVALALIDLDVHRLPNVIVVPAFITGLALLTLASAISGDWGALLTAALGSGAMFVFYLVLAIAVPRGMGFGDVKLAAVLGLHLGYLGWGAVLVGAFGAFLLGGIYSIALMIAGKAGRKSGIPFGPWMLLGAWIGIFAGRELSAGYLRLVGIG